MKSRSLLAGGFALALAVASVPAFQAVASTNENTPPGACIPGAAAGECPGEGDGEGDNGGDENGEGDDNDNGDDNGDGEGGDENGGDEGEGDDDDENPLDDLLGNLSAGSSDLFKK